MVNARADRLDDEWGYSDRDQRHRFNAFVLTKLGGGVTMNNRFTYTLASPASAKCGTNNAASTTRAGSAADRICPNGTILERNTLRRQNEYASWDLKFARIIKVRTGSSAFATRSSRQGGKEVGQRGPSGRSCPLGP